MTKEIKTKRHELGFLQIDPMPSEAELVEYYQKIYYQTPVSSTYATSYTEEEITYTRNRARVAEAVLVRLLGSSSRHSLADVGSGEGFFATHFLSSNWSVAAADFSIAGVQRQNPQLLPVFSQGNIFDILNEWHSQDRKFDCVNLGNILEHVREPLKLLDSTRGLLKSGGILRVCVPNDFSDFQTELVARGLTSQTWVSPPDHLSYFNFETLPEVLRHTGFSPLEFMADFPIELFLLNENSNYILDRSKGKAAHLARIRADNLLIEKNGLDNYIEMMKGAAKCSFGRTVIGYARAGSSD